MCAKYKHDKSIARWAKTSGKKEKYKGLGKQI